MDDQTHSAADVKELEGKLLQGFPAYRLEELAGLLADGFVEFGSSGKEYDKQAVLEGLAADTERSITMSDLKQIDLSPGSVLLTYRAEQQFPEGAVKRSLRSSNWQLIDSRWQIVFHQGTTIPDITE